MRQTRTASVTSAASSEPIGLDPRGFVSNTGLQLVISGTLTAKVQFTMDDIGAAGWTAGSANWFDHPTLQGRTTSDTGNLNVPVTAIRTVVTAYTSGSAYTIATQGEGT